MESTKLANKYYISNVLLFSISFFLGGIIIYILFNYLIINSWSSLFSFFGEIAIQISVSLIIIDLLLNTLARDVFRELLKKDFREIIGIENKEEKLLPLITHLMKPHPYHVLDIRSKEILTYNKKINTQFNIDTKDYTKVRIQVMEDNVHYRFKRGGPEGSKTKLLNVKLDGTSLDIKEDLIKEDGYYIIGKKLIKGESHNIEIVTFQENVMSDLSHKEIEKDFFEHCFIELTNKSINEYIFPFNLSEYEFFVKRIDSCGRKKYLMIKPTKDKKIKITDTNLDNGDRIFISYKKSEQK